METDNNFATKQDSSNNRLVTDERYKELKERMQELLKKQSSPIYNIDENPKDKQQRK